jgi:hypothetical protein
MRDIDLVEAVIKLHDVARLIESAVGRGQLSDDISPITQQIINKAKE